MRAGMQDKQIVASELTRIDDVRQFVQRVLGASQYAWTDNDLIFFELAAVEVFTNIVRHAHAERMGEQIALEAEDKLGGLEIRFRYAGEPFEANVPEEEDEPRLAEGGYGLTIIYGTMDRVENDQDEEGTMCITLWRAVAEDNQP